jgi:hypothetical protein
MDESSIEKTAFTAYCGNYEWLRLPFGLKNAPAEFCRQMYTVLGDMENVLVYMDDICIHTSTLEEHIRVLVEVFKRLRMSKLKINSKKCFWFQNKIKLLGHVIENNKISMDTNKIDSILNRKEPKNVRDIQVFLGLCNFYRKFIKDFAETVKPLTNLLHKSTKWCWDEKCKEAFEITKKLLTSKPVLRIPDLSRPFILYCDASEWALGVVLGQRELRKDGSEGDEYVCAYASRVLRGAEKNLSVTEKECLAVIYGLREFRVYLLGSKFTLYTDHIALTWLLNIKEPVGKLYRWAVLIQQYDFDIIYKKGSKHTNANMLMQLSNVLYSEVMGMMITWK